MVRRLLQLKSIVFMVDWVKPGASFLLQNGFYNKFKIIGIPDEYTVTGSQAEIFNHYGYQRMALQEKSLQLLKIKNDSVM